MTIARGLVASSPVWSNTQETCAFDESETVSDSTFPDLPSSLLARLHNTEIDAIARVLDDKVIAFATELAGNPA